MKMTASFNTKAKGQNDKDHLLNQSEQDSEQSNDRGERARGGRVDEAQVVVQNNVDVGAKGGNQATVASSERLGDVDDVVPGGALVVRETKDSGREPGHGDCRIGRHPRYQTAPCRRGSDAGV